MQAGVVEEALDEALEALIEGSVWLVPSELHSPIRQDALLLKRGENKQAAIDFLDFVQSDKAKKIIQTYGYRFE